MSQKSYQYSSMPETSHGRMICCTCGKRIKDGRYRVRERPDEYVTWHEECCADDPMWETIRRNSEREEARRQRFIQAVRVFKEEWGVDDLDHYLPEDLE